VWSSSRGTRYANALARLTPASGPQPRIPSGFGGCVGGFWGVLRPLRGRAAAANPPLQPKLLLAPQKPNTPHTAAKPRGMRGGGPQAGVKRASAFAV